jgi:predicted RND superfamily exporter protein
MTYLIYGALSMMAAVFAVLLLGLGIDFSIHLLTRFTEEMGEHDDIKKAFDHTSINTGKAVVLGALTTATAFGALLFSQVHGMHQMGAILAIGLLTTLFCVLFLFPALVTLRLRVGKLREKLQRRAQFKVLGMLGKVATRYAAVFVIVLVVFGAFVVYKAPMAKVNEDLHELQPKTVPSYKQLEKVKRNFNYTEDYLLSVAHSYDQLVEVVDRFRAIPEVMEVESVLDFLPQNQSAKLELFELAKIIHPEFIDISWLNITAMTWNDLPPNIQKSWVSEKPEGVSFLIRIKAWGNVWNVNYREELIDDLAAGNTTIVARAIMFHELIDIMTKDVIRVSLFAVVPILVIVYLGFRRRNPVFAILAVVPILCGIGGLLSLSGILGIDLNMVSIMMIPLVIGIGIDDGIHILHRYKEEGKHSTPRVVQNTGKAIFLTTVTTCLAFSSFTIAEHPGLRALGQVPVLGLILAFLAAVFFLPALIELVLERRNS